MRIDGLEMDTEAGILRVTPLRPEVEAKAIARQCRSAGWSVERHDDRWLLTWSKLFWELNTCARIITNGEDQVAITAGVSVDEWPSLIKFISSHLYGSAKVVALDADGNPIGHY